MEYFFRFYRRVLFNAKKANFFNDWKSYLLFDLTNPVLEMLCFSLIANHVYGTEYIGKWMIGNALLIASFGAIYKVGFQILIEKNSGTLSLIISSNTNLNEVFFSNIVYSMMSSLFSVILGTTLISILFRLYWSLTLVVSMLLVTFLAVFVAMCFGYFISCFVLISTEVHLLVNTLTKILLIFTGANFPISNFPNFIQFFSYSLPLTRSIQVAQSLMIQQSLSSLWGLLFQELVLGIFFLIIGRIILSSMEKVSIKRGTLDML